MRLVVCLLLVLVVVITVSCYENREYFASFINTTPAGGNIVTCDVNPPTVTDPPGTLFLLVNDAMSKPTILQRVTSKAIATTYDAKVSWDPNVPPKKIANCSTGYTYNPAPAPIQPTYTNPTLNDGDTVACAVDVMGGAGVDTLYQYVKNTNTLNAYADLATALLFDSNAAKPKVITDCSGYMFGKIIPKTILSGKTVSCSMNDPMNKGPTALYQYVNDTTLDYYATVDAARVMSGGSDTGSFNINPFVLGNCSRFKVGQTFDENSKPPSTKTKPNMPSGSNGSYGTMNSPGAQLGKSGSILYNPITGTPETGTFDGISLGANSKQPSNAWGAPVSLPSTPATAELPVASTPIRQDVKPEVSLSDTGYTAMDLQNKSSLLKDIQQIVHNELTSCRNSPDNNPISMQDASGSSCSASDSVNQGEEYKRSKIDMSEYIKKDAIPCWGCSLDY